jgi:hypothetical protein
MSIESLTPHDTAGTDAPLYSALGPYRASAEALIMICSFSHLLLHCRYEAVPSSTKGPWRRTLYLYSQQASVGVKKAEQLTSSLIGQLQAS